MNVHALPLLVTPLLLLALAASVHADPLFLAPFLSFDTGDQPQSVAIADLNSDGRPDLVTANLNSNTVAVLLGNGDTFLPRTDVDTGRSPSSVAIADLNSDGRPDLVTANAGLSGDEGTVSVLLGNGDGTFAAKKHFATGDSPLSVAIADLNLDGRPDLAVANSFSNTVSVLLGSGKGTFGAKTDFETGSFPNSVVIADLNGDGRPDLATASGNSHTVSVLLGNGDGTFGPRTDFGTGDVYGTKSVAVGDLNADGRLDLATANWFPGAASVLLGNGDGTFGAASNFATAEYAEAVAIGDLNADGRPDLVTANGGGGGWGGIGQTVSVLLGNGNGTFAPRNDFETGIGPHSVAIADLNADGRPDLATANSFSNTVSVLLGNGNGSFASEFGTGSYPVSVAAGDLNADGRPDLATANFASNAVSVLLGNGNGTFGSKTDFDTGDRPISVAIADLNADGRPDLAIANAGINAAGFEGHTVSVLLGNGNGTFGSKTDYATGYRPYSVAVGDLNADGRLDLATANAGGDAGWSQGNTVSVLLGNGNGAFGSKTDYATGYRPYSVAIADLNADGLPDLATANGGEDASWSQGNTVSVLLGNGNGTFGSKTDYHTGNGPSSVAIADLDLDGRPDLATANALSHTVSVLLGNGNGTFAPRNDFETGNGPHSVAIADLDSDGRLDLATASGFARTVSVLLGNGDGTFAPNTDYRAGYGASSVAIADFNSDGRPDVATANARSNTVSVLLHSGPYRCPLVPMSFDISPNTLNLRSMGHWVTATLEPVPPASPADIDIASIRLNHSVPVDASAPTSIGDADGDGGPDLTVKFSRLAVDPTLEEGDAIPVTVSGRIGDSCFEETELIRVIHAHGTAPSAGSLPPPFALTGAFPNPAERALTVGFSLRDGQPASLELYDVSGRRVLAREVGGLGPGVHRVALEAERALPSGVYMIRLTQGGHSLTTRAVLTQ